MTKQLGVDQMLKVLKNLLCVCGQEGKFKVRGVW